jgi:hypothetical protein
MIEKLHFRCPGYRFYSGKIIVVPGKPPKNGFSTFPMPLLGIYFKGYSKEFLKISTFSEASQEPVPKSLHFSDGEFT